MTLRAVAVATPKTVIKNIFNMVYEVQHEPWRSTYIALQSALTYFFLMPLWALSSIPRIVRPRPSWSAQKTFLLSYARHWSVVGPVVERVGQITKVPDHRAISDAPSVKSVWLEPTPRLLVGDVARWAEQADVRPISIPGYWYDKDGCDTPIGAPPEEGEKVVLYFHGSAFIVLSAHPHTMTGPCVPAVLRHSPAKRGLAVEYRLTGPASYANPFPAALIDCIAGYHYLIDVVGFAPENIILLGDSAGCNLALALARYIVDNIAELSTRMKLPPTPPSYSMVLLSPWCDLGTSHETPGSSALTFWYDYLADLRTGLMGAARRAYTHQLPPNAPEINPYISPASLHPGCHASFKGFPRTFIDVGTAERFLDMSHTLAQKMKRDLGDANVVYREAQDAVHCYMYLPFEAEEAAKSMKALEAFLE
ncbi:hypothetical protein POSPLDRAFT_99965 [Postia placenta Mad-698-R]|uniref:Alpha/beta hydrolase fold-3 domain-containing protein n=1 Tax=Postia placenta MAD-698-R-SB12 TaxID=670580 RepID=A0A1X6NBH8_9APHY|nr:hypothetical protein POSPLADRAFT_1132206 [Postia placenta MAD-698-R-SB12]EED79265.1 hypothetical protein POSPLDRAFT_99965 [Postia placenta Mad-698-R]OSX65995.1 hypothetical protein POSPLADRAFT_1132206 [Postia placenta MAD-698-R-SB12]